MFAGEYLDESATDEETDSEMSDDLEMSEGFDYYDSVSEFDFWHDEEDSDRDILAMLWE